MASNRYAAAHVSTQGAGDARPTALQIVRDESLEDALLDTVFFVTGCSSGIGVETARALAATGANVFCTARNIPKGEKALGELLKNEKVHLLDMDLESLDSVRSCAADFLSKSSLGRLNGLILNAGIRHVPEGKTKDGFETHFGVNHVAHFLLFELLRPALLASSTPGLHSRVVVVSSTAHREGEIHFDNLKLEGIYEPRKGYAQSKLANVYMANEIERRYGRQGLHGLSVHPGGIRTGLQRTSESFNMKILLNLRKVLKHLKSVEQGAATTIWAALSKEMEGKGGVYCENSAMGRPVEKGYDLMLDPGYEARAFDKEKEEKLWRVSMRLVGLHEDSEDQ